MYSELCDIWKQELESFEVGQLPSDFYSKITDYLRKLTEESRMLDKKTVKARLLQREARNAKQMIHEVLSLRFTKILSSTVEGRKIPSGSMSPEEERILMNISPLAEVHQNFVRNILRGHLPRANIDQKQRRTVLRLLKDVPAIVGVDMETYGPFRVEDVASFPPENARILIKRGLGEKIETDLR